MEKHNTQAKKDYLTMSRESMFKAFSIPRYNKGRCLSENQHCPGYRNYIQNRQFQWNKIE